MYLQNKNNKHSLQNNIVISIVNGKISENKKNVQTLSKITENEKSTFTVT